MPNLVRVCTLPELSPETMKGVQLDDGRRVLVVNLDGKLHAWDGTCTHEEADLSSGFPLGERVICPLHLSVFDLTTGAAVTPPATLPLKKDNLKIENEDIYIEVD